jgi:hypothetical protein
MDRSERLQKKDHLIDIELEDYAKYAKERLLVVLRGLPREQMVDRINMLHLSDRSLDYLCNEIAMEHEDYEICAAVITIKNARHLRFG